MSEKKTWVGDNANISRKGDRRDDMSTSSMSCTETILLAGITLWNQRFGNTSITGFWCKNDVCVLPKTETIVR